jgi:hypothetical protein
MKWLVKKDNHKLYAVNRAATEFTTVKEQAYLYTNHDEAWNAAHANFKHSTDYHVEQVGWVYDI